MLRSGPDARQYYTPLLASALEGLKQVLVGGRNEGGGAGERVGQREKKGYIGATNRGNQGE